VRCPAEKSRRLFGGDGFRIYALEAGEKLYNIDGDDVGGWARIIQMD
jgi:hypothetical protein